MSEGTDEPSPDARQKAVDDLCEHFANDALTVEEFERRVDRAHKAESARELQALLADLPGGSRPIPEQDRFPGRSAPAVENDRSGEAGAVQPAVPPSRVKERGFVVAALAGAERKGRWIPARTNFSISVMGGTTLDFREALLPPGETEVWVVTFMGGCEIIVPPGLTVESDGVAILGGFEHREDVQLQRDSDAPVLVVRGFAVLGGVEVSTRLAGESAREAKRRRRHQEKEKRRLNKGGRRRRHGR